MGTVSETVELGARTALRCCALRLKVDSRRSGPYLTPVAPNRKKDRPENPEPAEWRVLAALSGAAH